eukprot:scaffold22408_cov34-Attheya_sp.AAC.1
MVVLIGAGSDWGGEIIGIVVVGWLSMLFWRLSGLLYWCYHYHSEGLVVLEGGLEVEGSTIIGLEVVALSRSSFMVALLMRIIEGGGRVMGMELCLQMSFDDLDVQSVEGGVWSLAGVVFVGPGAVSNAGAMAGFVAVLGRKGREELVEVFNEGELKLITNEINQRMVGEWSFGSGSVFVRVLSSWRAYLRRGVGGRSEDGLRASSQLGCTHSTGLLYTGAMVFAYGSNIVRKYHTSSSPQIVFSCQKHVWAGSRKPMGEKETNSHDELNRKTNGDNLFCKTGPLMRYASN